MIKNLLKLEKLYFDLLQCKLSFKEYLIINNHKGKCFVVYKSDLIKGLWVPKVLK